MNPFPARAVPDLHLNMKGWQGRVVLHEVLNIIAAYLSEQLGAEVQEQMSRKIRTNRNYAISQKDAIVMSQNFKPLVISGH